MKQHKNNSIFIKTIACFCAVLILGLYMNITPTKASVLSDAVLDSGNAAERQFWEKVKIIKSVFPSQIDDVALAATVLYNGSSSGILSEQYDKDFDSNKFKERIEGINQAKDNIEENPDQDYERAEGQQVDILIAATIVMLDSSGWIGTYSDENYEKALAGDGLVGNMSDEGDIFADVFDSVFCKVGELVDPIANSIFDTILGTNDKGYGTNRTAMRYYNMQNICDNGFIGGTVENVRLMEDKEKQQATKRSIAKGIIKLAETYRKIFGEQQDCIVNPGSNGDYTSWKQYSDEWKDIKMGDGTIKRYGCLVTSLAIQIARSGTAITNLPAKYSTFNPGAFVTSLKENGGIDSTANFQGRGWEKIASNVKIKEENSFGTVNTNSGLAKLLSNELSTGAEEGKYQKYIVIKISAVGHPQHWIAIDSVTNNSVTLMDPGAEGVTLDDNYVGWEVSAYKVLYATDVPFGQGGTSTSGNNYCNNSGDGIFPGTKYTDMTDEQLKTLTAVCIREQGSDIEGVKFEASLMANLFELRKNGEGGASGLYNYVNNGGWFGSPGFHDIQLSRVTDELKNAVKEVLIDGNRTLPPYVDEHDCWFCNSRNTCGNGNLGDICYLEVDGTKYTDKISIKDKNNYITDKTVIHNVYGSVYTFYAFPPSGGDPFGYTANSKKKFGNT
ncbi:MAG: hypothetical protein HFJ17_05350 [Clostridia bacterium]|nr:hypothetical protein [Clostridia bacterium]